MTQGIIAIIVISVSILIFLGAFKTLWKMMGFASNAVKSIIENGNEIGGGEPHFNNGLPPAKEVEAYTAKISKNPEDYLLYFERGKNYEQLEDYDNALQDYSRCIELKSDFADALIRRGLLQMERQNYSEAQKDFENLISKKPEEYAGYELMGNLLFQKGEWEKAGESLSKAIDSYDKDLSLNLIYEKRSYVHFCLGDYQNAMTDIEKTLDLSEFIKPGDDIFLYRFILLNRLGIDGTKELFAFKGKFARESMLNSFETEWLHCLIKLYLNETDPSPCIAEMNRLTGELDQEGRPRCIIGFYIAQWYLMKKEYAQAKKYLGICMETGRENIDEYHMAKAELKRI